MLAKWSSVLLALVLWATPAWAQALTGTVVGPFSCTFTWSLPTNSDLSPYTGTILSYRLYLQTTATPLPVLGVTTPAIVVTGSPVPLSSPCTGTPSMVVGQMYAWITAIDAKGETALSAVLPFIWSLTPPVIIFTNPPGSLKVQ